MLFLVFQLGDDRYAIDVTQVVEVLPLVNWKCIPRAPVGVAGVIDYRGMPVPLLDLTELAMGRPSRRWMSTRIIVVNYGWDCSQTRLLALIAERATELIRRNEADFSSPGLTIPDSPYLGSITSSSAGVIQRIAINSLLSNHVRDQLFPDRAPITE
jgi:chemotaxis-related protein WspB